MAAGAGKLCSLAVLLVALLAMFIAAPPTTADAARPQLTMESLNKELMSAFGMSGGGYQPCCTCACTRRWPPEANMCACGGFWEGSCPSVCKDCSCDEDNRCSCQDGFTIKYNDCMSNACASTAHLKKMM